LEDLDNFDKHRFPPVVTVGGLIPSFNIGHLQVGKLIGPRLGPVKADTEIMRFVPLPQSPMNMGFPSTYHIAVAEGKPGQGHSVIAALSALRNLIRTEIVEPLDSYL
jgi:hypothetical protein